MADDPTQQHPLPPNPEEFDYDAFVVKVYASAGRDFRGHITHAASRRSKPIRQPEDLLAFLEPYVTAMHVRLRPMSRLILWMSRMSSRGRIGRPGHSERG